MIRGFGLYQSVMAALLTVAVGSANAAQSPQLPLAPSAIPQFVQPLPRLNLSPGGTMATGFGNGNIDLTMCEFDAKVLPSGTLTPGIQPLTRTFGYILGTECPTTPQDTYLGPLLVNTRNGGSTNIRFVNKLGSTDTTQVPVWQYATDQTLHWADPLNGEQNMCNHMAMFPPFNSECAQNYSGPIPAVPHLHGGEVPPELDGGPDGWFTSDGNYRGHGYYTSTVSGDTAPANGAIYRYPNTQEASPIWFHDHVLGATRLNVYAGLAGAYLITDPTLQLPAGLHPAGLLNGAGGSVEYTVPIIIQDRMFDLNGQLFFQTDSAGGVLWSPNPEHPYWSPEFVGDTIVVNGKAWPFLNVEPKRYRFWFVNGSNARTYEMFLTDPVSKNFGPPIYLIATDGGYLDSPVKIDPTALKPANALTMMPGERYEAIVDFNGYAAGNIGPNGSAYSGKWVLKNNGKTPYPAGAAPQGGTTGKIMQFVVGPCTSQCGPNDASYNPAGGGAIRINPAQKVVRLANPATGTLAAGVTIAKTRQLTLNEVMGMPQTVTSPVTGLPTAYPGGPLEILVNNTKWSGERITGVMSTGMYSMEPIPGFTVDGNGKNYFSELPYEGETEVWEIANLTADAHPIHLHLVQFQIMNRQNFDAAKYAAAYAAAFPGGGYDPMTLKPYPAGVFIPGFGPPLPYAPSAASGQKYGGNPDTGLLVKGKPVYLQGVLKPPAANEAGWKDTIIALPGQITRIAVRYAPTDKPTSAPASQLSFPFDTFAGGHFNYVWHCHIIDHEDNEMMRPMSVQTNPLATGVRLQKGVDY